MESFKITHIIIIIQIGVGLNIRALGFAIILSLLFSSFHF
jgi:hypothetical protein